VVVPDPYDPKVAKKARNTEAARKFRERQREELEQYVARVAELEEGKRDWKEEIRTLKEENHALQEDREYWMLRAQYEEAE